MGFGSGFGCSYREVGAGAVKYFTIDRDMRWHSKSSAQAFVFAERSAATVAALATIVANLAATSTPLLMKSLHRFGGWRLTLATLLVHQLAR
jgi:hypothetical protein